MGLFGRQQGGRKRSKIRQKVELRCDVVTTKVLVDPREAGMPLLSCPKLKLSLYVPSGSYTSSSLQPLFWGGLSCEISTGNTPNSLLELGGQGSKCLGSGDTLQQPLQSSRRMSTLLLSIYAQLSRDNIKISLKFLSFLSKPRGSRGQTPCAISPMEPRFQPHVATHQPQKLPSSFVALSPHAHCSFCSLLSS